MWARRLARAIAGAALVAGLGAGSSLAEVAAVLTSDGRYVRTEINLVQRDRQTSVWLTSDRVRDQSGMQRVALNTGGAARGDGVPSIAVNPLTRLPWAVWSFNENGDSELAVSIFDGTRWSNPILLGTEPNGIADLEPKMLFTPDGRPIITWWRLSSDGQEQSVWVTSRAGNVWMTPFRLSTARVRASRPTLMLRGTDLIIAYDSNLGIQIRTLSSGAPSLGGHQGAGGVDGPDPPTNNDSRPPECQLIGCDGD